jgi:hypothetical protein
MNNRKGCLGLIEPSYNNEYTEISKYNRSEHISDIYTSGIRQKLQDHTGSLTYNPV